MLARYASAILSLLAFTIVIVNGLLMQNPFVVTLSRALFALFLFSIIGFLLGGAAQLVVDEQREDSSTEIERRYHAARRKHDDVQAKGPSPTTEGGAMSG